MKKVFELAEELRRDPNRVALTQALTFNAGKPDFGLRGNKGLFGSAEWWASIESGSTPSKKICGTIERAYYVGPGGDGPNNMIEIVTNEGVREEIGIYINDPSDICFFVEGHKVEVVYAFDELKRQPAPGEGVSYSRVALSMSVSTQPVQ
ncbi:hypothetical protein TPR58_18970 [Sphingomonas sp. HF-S3]|uniref:Uncharacterized protein n=1 Tax=Sphingomonas rustica TaxID=3103142 RepID=A0ABV0BE02_9SPHN